MLDTRTAVLDGIKDRLCAYAARVNLEQGRLSDSAEEFYRALLNIMLGYNLKNMNRERPNFPGIDLGDDSEGVKLGVQVTSTGTHAKVKHTLEEFFGKKLHKRFDRLIVLIIGRADRLDKQLPEQDGFDFQVSRDVWDTLGLIRQIEELDDDKLEKVAAFLTQRVSFRRRERVLHLPVQGAMREKDFVGRQEEMRRIDEELAREGVAVLSGLGGMGKTELALKWGHEYRIGNVYFVRFTTNFRRTLLDNIAPYIPSLSREGKTEDQIYAEAMAVLDRCDPLDVLILDNADKAEQSVDQLFRELRGLPLRVLVTTRAEDKHAIYVDRLENERLYEIFRGHGTDLTEPEMDELIDAVDSHTLTVDLMARSMRPGRRATTAEKLLDALHKRNLNSASFMQVATNYPGGLKQARINEHLRTVFRVAELTVVEQEILLYATLLPASGMDPDLFMELFEEDAEVVLDDLINKGWLLWKKELLLIHPVIRIVCREELKPTDENCGDFLEGMWEEYESGRCEMSWCYQIAMMFDEAASCVEVIKKKLEDRAVSILWKLTEEQCALGNYDAAYEYSLKALGIRKHKQNDLCTLLDNNAINYSIVMSIWEPIKMPIL